MPIVVPQNSPGYTFNMHFWPLFDNEVWVHEPSFTARRRIISRLDIFGQFG